MSADAAVRLADEDHLAPLVASATSAFVEDRSTSCCWRYKPLVALRPALLLKIATLRVAGGTSR